MKKLNEDQLSQVSGGAMEYDLSHLNTNDDYGSVDNREAIVAASGDFYEDSMNSIVNSVGVNPTLAGAYEAGVDATNVNTLKSASNETMQGSAEKEKDAVNAAGDAAK